MSCFRISQYMLESMFPSMKPSSPVPADHDATPTILDCWQDTIFLIYSLPGRHHTGWIASETETNKFILVSSDHMTCFQ